ncbi:Chemosensory protein A 56a [Carabus blaptoides fortunei]
MHTLTFANYRDVTVEQVKLLYLDKSLADFNYTINKISNTDYKITAYLNVFKEEVNDEDGIILQLYSFHNNKYRLTPIQVARKTCQFLNMEWQYVKHNIKKYGNMPTSCPMKKGLYYVKDFIVYPATLPNLPWDNIRCDLNFTVNGRTTGALQIFIKIDRN